MSAEEGNTASPSRSCVENAAGVMVYYAAERTLMPRLSAALGMMALVFGGAIMTMVAAVRYAGLEMRFRREGVGAPGHGLPLGVLFTLFVMVIGIVIGIILAKVR
jgi:hypothetical protein